MAVMSLAEAGYFRFPGAAGLGAEADAPEAADVAAERHAAAGLFVFAHWRSHSWRQS